MKHPHLTPHPPPPPMPAPDYDTAAGSIYSVKGGGGGGRGIYDVSLYPPPGPPNQVDMKSDPTVVWNSGNAAPILYGSAPPPPPPMSGSNPGPPPPPPLADPLGGVPVPGGGPR